MSSAREGGLNDGRVSHEVRPRVNTLLQDLLGVLT